MDHHTVRTVPLEKLTERLPATPNGPGPAGAHQADHERRRTEATKPASQTGFVAEGKFGLKVREKQVGAGQALQNGFDAAIHIAAVRMQYSDLGSECGCAGGHVVRCTTLL